MSRNTKSLQNGRSKLGKLECETVLMEERLVTLRRQLESDRRTRELKNKVPFVYDSGWDNLGTIFRIFAGNFLDFVNFRG